MVWLHTGEEWHQCIVAIMKVRGYNMLSHGGAVHIYEGVASVIIACVRVLWRFISCDPMIGWYSAVICRNGYHEGAVKVYGIYHVIPWLGGSVYIMKEWHPWWSLRRFMGYIVWSRGSVRLGGCVYILGIYGDVAWLRGEHWGYEYCNGATTIPPWLLISPRVLHECVAPWGSCGDLQYPHHAILLHRWSRHSLYWHHR